MYISGESPATCFQVMPLLLLGISTKAEWESGSLSARRGFVSASDFRPPRRPAGANVAPNPDKPSSCSQRRREIMTGKRGAFARALDSGAALEPTCSVRRFRRGCWRFGGCFALELHFARCAFLASRAVIGDGQLIVARGIFGEDLHIFFERRNRF